MNTETQKAIVWVVSSPSGGGKTTLCQRLLADFPSMRYSISCTTRAPRPGEVDGTHYRFLPDTEFEKRVQKGDFLEWAWVHGCRYGTPKGFVLDMMATGHDVLMAIDVQGARRVRDWATSAAGGASIRNAFADVFVVPPSLDALRERLVRRGDALESIEQRLRNAEQELLCWKDYRYLVVNDRLDDAYDRLRSIVKAEHCRIIN